MPKIHLYRVYLKFMLEQYRCRWCGWLICILYRMRGDDFLCALGNGDSLTQTRSARRRQQGTTGTDLV